MDYMDLRFYVFVVAIPVTVLCGIVGNVLSFVVLGWDRLQKSTAFTLRALALADTIFLVLCIPNNTVLAFYETSENLSTRAHTYWYEFYIYEVPLFDASQMVSTWMLVLVTIERYILVCHPLKAARYVNMSKLTMAVAAVWVGAILFHVPYFIHTICNVNVTDNHTIPCTEFRQLELYNQNMSGNFEVKMGTSKYFVSSHYHFAYKTLGYILMVFAIPFIILLTLTFKLYSEIKRSHSRHTSLTIVPMTSSTQPREQPEKYTRIVITIVILFCLCLLPKGIFRLLNSLMYYKLATPPKAFRISFDAIVSFSLTLNSSCNFIIYCVMRRNFRKLVKKLFKTYLTT